MAMHYTDSSREHDPHSLPDLETFYVSTAEFRSASSDTWMAEIQDGGEIPPEDCAGWYYWFCLPGCLPDSEPHGPFATEAEALSDARNGHESTDESIEP